MLTIPSAQSTNYSINEAVYFFNMTNGIEAFQLGVRWNASVTQKKHAKSALKSARFQRAFVYQTPILIGVIAYPQTKMHPYPFSIINYPSFSL